MIRTGVIGVSEGNGHPFSFSAIVNGYSDEGFEQSGWPVIHDYLKERRPEEFGFDGVRVTHAWTQDREQTKKLCRATKIEHCVSEPRQMLGRVDAVLIARDDWRSHYRLAKPFLDSGVAVFVDKPLSLDSTELQYFKPYLERGLLMSCSGLRFARELLSIGDLGEIRCINGTVVNDWERYGVHLLDAVFNSVSARPLSIARQPAVHDSLVLAMDDGSVVNLNAIGVGPKTFRLEYIGSRRRFHVDLTDNFSAFRSTLDRFFQMCRSGMPAIEPADTLMLMHTLMAGNAAQRGGAHVAIC